MHSRLAAVAASAALLTTAAAACGSGTSTSGPAQSPKSPTNGRQKIAVAYADVTQAVPLYKSVGDGLQSLANSQGDTFYRYDNKLDPTAGLSNARLIAQQHPDVAIDWSGAGNNAAAGAVFTRAGIPCIAVTFPVQGCRLFDLNQESFGAQIGVSVAAAVAKKGWTSNNTFVLLVAATIAGIAPIRNSGGFYSAFAQAFPGLDQRSADSFTLTTTTIGHSGLMIDGGGTVDGAYAATQRALQVIPPNKNLVIYSPADPMAVGATRALQQAGWMERAIVSSTGADPNSLAGLRAGATWIAEGDLGLQNWPAYLLAMARALRAGTPLPESTYSPFQVLTPANVNTFYSGDKPSKQLPVPSLDEYLRSYGLDELLSTQ